MIVTVCADKGSPGVSTTAAALGMVWPGERVVLEADPSGGGRRPAVPDDGGPVTPSPANATGIEH